MVTRKVFFVGDTIKSYNIEFKFHPGFSITQKQKSIRELHTQISKQFDIPIENILEISTKSEVKEGVQLSAFNLKTKTQIRKREFSVESAYHSSKVFEFGGPYRELLYFDSKKAKKDIRIKNSGKLKYFDFYNNRFELSSGTKFYDWIYINVLLKNIDLRDITKNYSAFTDIEFNSNKSYSTQAYSIALYNSLKKAKIDMSNFRNPRDFLEKTHKFYEI